MDMLLHNLENHDPLDTTTPLPGCVVIQSTNLDAAPRQLGRSENAVEQSARFLIHVGGNCDPILSAPPWIRDRTAEGRKTFQVKRYVAPTVDKDRTNFADGVFVDSASGARQKDSGQRRKKDPDTGANHSKSLARN
jgi:hypothetical protein